MTLRHKFFRENAFGKAYVFVLDHWKRQPGRLTVLLVFMLAATLADTVAPLYAGRIVNALGQFGTDGDVARQQALVDFAIMMGLGLVMIGARVIAFSQIVTFTLKMMPEVAREAFFKVQRLSSDWHANSFAGSTVRKITRAMWSLDGLNDTLILAMFSKVVMLLSASVLLWVHWPVLGLVVGLGSAAYVALVAGLSLGYLAPAAQLSNAWDTRVEIGRAHV